MDWGGDQGHKRRMWAGTLLGIAIWAQGTEVRRSLVWLEVRSDSSQDLFGKWWQLSSYSETERLMAVYLCILFMYFCSFIYLFIFDCAGSLLLCRLFSSCGEPGHSLVAMHRLLVVVASLAVEHGCLGFSSCSMWGPVHRLKSCGPVA